MLTSRRFINILLPDIKRMNVVSCLHLEGKFANKAFHIIVFCIFETVIEFVHVLKLTLLLHIFPLLTLGLRLVEIMIDHVLLFTLHIFGLHWFCTSSLFTFVGCLSICYW